MRVRKKGEFREKGEFCVSSVWGRFSATRKIHSTGENKEWQPRGGFFMIGLKQNEFFFLKKNKMPPTNRWAVLKQQYK